MRNYQDRELYNYQVVEEWELKRAREEGDKEKYDNYEHAIELAQKISGRTRENTYVVKLLAKIEVEKPEVKTTVIETN